MKKTTLLITCPVIILLVLGSMSPAGYAQNNFKAKETISMDLAKKEAREVPYHILAGFFDEYDIYWDEATEMKRQQYIINYNNKIIKHNMDVQQALLRQEERKRQVDQENMQKEIAKQQRELKRQMKKQEKELEKQQAIMERERKRQELDAKLRSRQNY